VSTLHSHSSNSSANHVSILQASDIELATIVTKRDPRYGSAVNFSVSRDPDLIAGRSIIDNGCCVAHWRDADAFDRVHAKTRYRNMVSSRTNRKIERNILIAIVIPGKPAL
jgi:hypothetical protein